MELGHNLRIPHTPGEVSLELDWTIIAYGPHTHTWSQSWGQIHFIKTKYKYFIN